jgi:hypothetical protein
MRVKNAESSILHYRTQPVPMEGGSGVIEPYCLDQCGADIRLVPYKPRWLSNPGRTAAPCRLFPPWKPEPSFPTVTFLCVQKSPDPEPTPDPGGGFFFST